MEGAVCNNTAQNVETREAKRKEGRSTHRHTDTEPLWSSPEQSRALIPPAQYVQRCASCPRHFMPVFACVIWIFLLLLVEYWKEQKKGTEWIADEVLHYLRGPDLFQSPSNQHLLPLPGFTITLLSSASHCRSVHLVPSLLSPLMQQASQIMPPCKCCLWAKLERGERELIVSQIVFCDLPVWGPGWLQHADLHAAEIADWYLISDPGEALVMMDAYLIGLRFQPR